jgi:hypothetical protein
MWFSLDMYEVNCRQCIILSKNKEKKRKKWSMQNIIVEDHTLYSTFQVHSHRKRFTYFVLHFFLYSFHIWYFRLDLASSHQGYTSWTWWSGLHTIVLSFVVFVNNMGRSPNYGTLLIWDRQPYYYPFTIWKREGVAGRWACHFFFFCKMVSFYIYPFINKTDHHYTL